MRLLNFVRSLPRPAPEPAAGAESHAAAAAPVADIPNPRVELHQLICQYIEDFVSQANVESPTEDGVRMLCEGAMRMVERQHRSFLPGDRARLSARIDEASARRTLLIQDTERALARVIRLEQDLGAPPPREEAAALSVVASVGLYAFGIGASIQPLFATDDASISWAYALIFGLTAGVVIVWAVLGLSERRKP